MEKNLVDFYLCLEEHKKIHLLFLSKLSYGNKIIYLEKLRENFVNYLFKKDSLIMEIYEEIFPKNLLIENKFNLSKELTKMNNFIFNSVCFKYGLIKKNDNSNPLSKVKKTIYEQRISDLKQNQQANTENLRPNLPKQEKPWWSKLSNSEIEQFKYSQPSVYQEIKKEQEKIKKEQERIEQAKWDAKIPKLANADTNPVGSNVKKENDPLVFDKSELIATQDKTEVRNLRPPGSGDAKAKEYLDKRGFEGVMEDIRSFLFSWTGAAIQMLLSTTGIGAIANELAWAVMFMFDGYKILNQGGGMYYLFAILDIIGLLTAGNATSPLGNLIKSTSKKSFQSFRQAIDWILTTNYGKILKPFVQIAVAGIKSVGGWISKAANWIYETFGLEWVFDLKNGIIELTSFISKELGYWIEAGAKKVIERATRNGVEYNLKEAFDLAGFKEILSQLAIKMGNAQQSQGFKEVFNKGSVKAVEAYIKQYTREEPTETMLRAIDSKFGSHWGDLYMTYLASKKSIKSGAGIPKPENIVKNVLRADNPVLYTGQQLEKAQKSAAETFK